jgi:sugar lactone lactonase YvrE
MTDATMGRSQQRGTRRVLIALIVILLLLFCSVLYVLFSMVRAPQRIPTLSKKPGVEYVWSSFGGVFGRIHRPFGVAYDGSNRIYVTEPQAARVTVYDANGKNGRVFVQADAKNNDITYPNGIDVGGDGSVYIADPQRSSVVVFDPAGKKVREIKLDHAPIWVTVTRNRLYTTDKGTLYITDLQGNPLGKWGSFGRGVDQLSYPGGVAVDAAGRIYITDTNNYRIVGLDANLNRLWQAGKTATTEAQAKDRALGGPAGITLGKGGNPYFLDGVRSQIGVLDKSSGGFASQPLSDQGNNDDQLFLPRSIDSMGGDLFVITDQFHDRIVAFRITPQP